MVRINPKSTSEDHAGSIDEMKKILVNQKALFINEPNISWSKRKENLKKLGSIIQDHESDFINSISIDFGNRENQFDPEKNINWNKDRFIFRANSAESGKVTFGEIYSEFEFRPEYLDLSLTDNKCLISGIEYLNPDTDESYHSDMELLNSRTHETDISLVYKNKDGKLIDANYYEDIKDSILENGEEINEKTIDSYFKK